MKTFPLITGAVLAIALSACSGGKRAPEPAASSDAGAEAAGASTSPASTAEVEHSIPESLRGRWGLVPTDCTSTQGDAKGLLTVSGDTLTFYESAEDHGTITTRGTDRESGV